MLNSRRCSFNFVRSNNGFLFSSQIIFYCGFLYKRDLWISAGKKRGKLTKKILFQDKKKYFFAIASNNVKIYIIKLCQLQLKQTVGPNRVTFSSKMIFFLNPIPAGGVGVKLTPPVVFFYITQKYWSETVEIF